MKIDVEDLKRGITIADILDDFGIKYRSNRCACPVHSGDNPTAFAFNKDTYYCHTQGCRGDVITLIQALRQTDFLGAMEYLARKNGVILNLPEKRAVRVTKLIKQKPANSRLLVLKEELCLNRSLTSFYENRLKQLTLTRKKKTITEVQYYTDLHCLENSLDELDAERTELHFEINKVKNGR